MVASFLKNIYIYATDSVWGIGSNAFSEKENDWMRDFKGREANTPFSLLFSSLEQLKQYFRLDEFVEQSSFVKLFTLESTLLIPREFCITAKIGPWIYADSAHIGVRVVNLPWIKELTADFPITSTSLNFSGNESISTRDQAYQFWQDNCPECSFIEPSSDFLGSKVASTIIKFDIKSESDLKCVSITREGKRVSEIKKLLGL